jgi:hypothetical protein
MDVKSWNDGGADILDVGAGTGKAVFLPDVCSTKFFS